MNAMVHDFALRSSPRPDPARSLGIEWELLLDSGARVAKLAGEIDWGDACARELLNQFEKMAPAHRTLLEQHVADLADIMQPGLLRLESVAAKGRDVQVDAEALWREFLCARNSIIALAAR